MRKRFYIVRTSDGGFIRHLFPVLCDAKRAARRHGGRVFTLCEGDSLADAKPFVF